MKDFFVSYNSADRQWAEWITWQLEEAGYEVEIQAWDSQAGKNFIEWMDKASKNASQTIAVLSPSYLKGKFSLAEWTAALYEEKLLPIRIQDFDVKGLFGPIVYIDLVGLEEEKAKEKLLKDVRLERKKPLTAPRFPESIKHTISKATRFPGGLPSIWNVPFKRNPFFTGREEILSELHKSLASSQLQTLCGLGGIGKTQTVVEYAYRFCNEYDAVLWVNADTKESLLSSFSALADKRIIDLHEQKANDQQKILNAVHHWLKEHTNWLLIFDNADNPDILKDYIPYNPEGHILLTSRAQIFDQLGIAKPIEITKMSPGEAQEFLIKRTGRNDVSNRDIVFVKQLAQEFDYLPLALEQASAYISRKKCLVENYLMSYNKRGLKLLEKSTVDPDKYPRSVATTWLMNFEQVEQVSKASADLFRASMFLNPDQIPIEFIIAGRNELGPNISEAMAHYDSDPVVLDELLEPLTQYSLINRDILSQAYNIHRLVQAVYIDMMDEETQRQWAERTSNALLKAMPSIDEFSIQKINLATRIISHIEICLQHNLILNFPLLYNSISQLYLHDRSRYYATAETSLRKILDFAETWFGSDHPIVATNLNSLAVHLRDQGKYSEAEPLFRRALDLRETNLGKDHPDVATSLNDLALLLQAQSKYAEAEPLINRALDIYEAKIGKNHPDLVLVLYNLAALRMREGNYADAELLSRRALDIREAKLGKDHPDREESLNIMAELLRTQGKLVDPEPLFRRALDIGETKLGKNHLDVAMSLRHLAFVLQIQGKYDEAEPLFRRSLDIREVQLGKDHLDVAESLNTLAVLLQIQGKYDDSEQLLRRALEIREAQLGKDHLDGAESLNTLALSLKDQGNYAEAESLIRRALNIREAQLGKDHPDVAESLNTLAELLRTQGKYTKAEPLIRRALNIREAQLGKNDPLVAISLNDLALLLHSQGKYAEAEPLYRRALNIVEAQLGKDHPTTQTVSNNLKELLEAIKASN